MIETFDAIVIGGGPAGSTCAARFVRAGLNVLLLDRRTFPRDKTCAGWITPAVVETLGLDLAEYAAANVLQPITAFRVSMMGGPEQRLRYDEPVSYGIRRCEFDAYLLERCGATLKLGEPVQSLRRADGLWHVNDAYAAPLLIGAGGHACPVARHINGGEGSRRERVVAAQEIEFRLTESQRAACAIASEEPQLFFCRDLAGYGWCFRKGDYLNVGLGREDPHRLAAHVQAFMEELKERGRIPPDTPTRMHGHSYILYGHQRRKRIDDGVLLIGDAAGMAYPQSGEGIRTAIESAILAARTAIDAAGRYDRNHLQPYAIALTQRFGPERNGDDIPLPAWLRTALAACLMRTSWFVRRIVVERWFLHREVPALVSG